MKTEKVGFQQNKLKSRREDCYLHDLWEASIEFAGFRCVTGIETGLGLSIFCFNAAIFANEKCPPMQHSSKLSN